MRLALVGPVYPYSGGIAHYTTRLEQALGERGHEVLLVSFRRQYPRWLFPGDSDRDPSQTPLHAENAHFWLDSLNPLTWLTTFLRIRNFGAQVIVLQWWTSFWAPVWMILALLNAAFLQARLVFLCHNVLPHDARPWTRWLTRLVLGMGQHFIVQSAEESRQLHTLLPGAVVEIVPHPVYAMFSGQRICKNEARQRLMLPVEGPVLLFFGIIRPYKGLGDLIEALPAVRQYAPTLRVLIAGEFWEDKTLHLARIHQLQLAEIVQIDDRYIPNEEVAIYFSAADLLVAPYRQSTGSGVIELAKSFGLPVVTAARSEAPHAEVDELSSAAHTRSAQLATAIIDCLEHPTEQAERPTPADERASWQRLVVALEGAI